VPQVGRRLLVLALVGVLMTLSVVATALLSVRDMNAVNRELARVSSALNHHKTADEMHDALRADVARAQLAGSGQLTVPGSVVRRETHRHAARFRAELEAVSSVDLPVALQTALRRLRPTQEIYVVTAERTVASALSPTGLTAGAQTDYEAAFAFLVPEQNRMTQRLLAATQQAQRAATAQRRQAEGTIGVAAVIALAGWLALAGWQHRSTRRLHAALIREADHRATADLLQRSLLPSELPRVAGAKLAAHSVPGNARNRVGGDWYDAINLPTGEVLLVVGDVVGHDLPAATVMGQLRNGLRAYALEDASPASVLTRVNRAAHLLDTSDLATCICVRLDPVTLVATWASAGHPPPLLAGADRPRRRMLTGEPGPPLGVTAPAAYPEHHLQLHSGDTLLLYSDGLVERRGVPIDVGMAALETLALERMAPEEMCERLLTAMLHNGANPDDVTCLLLHVEAGPSGTPDRAPAPDGAPTTCG
jgi:serine phosphatase RsbU (regulator of sigma subunit)